MSKNNDNFKMLDDRSHILLRPAMWIGSVDEGDFQEYILENDKIIYKQVNYVPGFMKIINEIIDNAIDEAVRTSFKFATKINISFDDDAHTITVEDNGRGIPVEQISGEWKPKLAWTMARSGTNFEEGHLGPGANGVGSCATNCYSASFIGDTNDGVKRCIVTCKNNMEEIDVKIKEGNKQKQGTKVTFKPDLKRFKLTPKKVFSSDSVYKQLIYQRLLNLSICYPNITFKYSGKTLKTNNIKNIMKLFGDSFEFASNDNCIIAVFPNPDDDFRQFSYMNGLKITNGGSHIDVLVNDIVQGIREKLLKKYKSIKPGEIKSKLFVVMYGNNFTNPKYDSQTKERITNSTADIRAFLNGIDTEKLIKQCLKNDNLIDPIIEIYKIKEEYANRKAIEDAVAPKKKVTSKKYLPATLKQKYLVLGEGKCLDKDTPIIIINKDTPITLNEVEIGDCVLTHKQRIKRVLNKTRKIVKCYKLRTKSGKEVIASDEHRFFCYDTLTDSYKWKKVKNINVKTDKIIINKLIDKLYLGKIEKIEKADINNLHITLDNIEIKSSNTHRFVVYDNNELEFNFISANNLNPDIHQIAFILDK